MIGAIIEIVIGWFLIEKVSSIVGAYGILSTVIKIIGVIVLIGGLVSLAHCFFSF